MAGVVARIYNWVTDKANSVKITASRQDAELNQLIVALNKKVLCATSAPSSPIAGQTWVDTTNKIMKIYINNEWVGMGAVHVSTTAPTTLQEGFLWYDTTNNVLKTYSGSAWQSVLSNLSAIDTKTTPVLADSVAIVDSENSDVNKIATLTSIKTAIGEVVQQVRNTLTTAPAGFADAFVFDDTPPTYAETTEILAQAITPTNASNLLFVEVVVHCGAAAGDTQILSTLHKAEGTAIAAGMNSHSQLDNSPATISYNYRGEAGTTSEVEFQVNMSDRGGSTLYVNGISTGRLFGGALVTSITITEIKV